MDKDFSCHVEQSDGQSHSFPHKEHQQQQDDLSHRGKPDVFKQSQNNQEKMNFNTRTMFTYSEDGGSNGIDEQLLSAVPADLHLCLLHFGGCVISVQPMVDVEPPEDAGPR